jgi:hypothetical protein
MRAPTLLAVLVLGTIAGLLLAAGDSPPRLTDAEAAAGPGPAGIVSPAQARAVRGTKRGRFGYGRRYTRPRGLTPRQIERIKSRHEKEEEGQPSPPGPPGPHPGPRNDPSDTEPGAQPYPFRAGRRSDEPSLPMPDWPSNRAADRGVVRLHKAGPRVSTAQAGDDFVMPRNQPVVQGAGFTSTVGEPSWANDGPVILYTGNWHAHISEDDGINWDYLPPIDPFADREEVDGGFAGDQVAYAVDHEGERLIFWVIFYYNDGTDNTIRLQVYHGGDELADQVGHCTYDFKPTDFYSQGATAWIDQPRIASTDEYLYMAGGVFDLPGDEFVESKIWRIALDDLAQTDCDDPIEYSHYINTTNGVSDGNAQFVQGADDVMYWAYSDYTSPNHTLEVWRLADSAGPGAMPTGTSYPLTSYPTAGPHDCTTPGPTVSNPCGDATATTRPEMGWLSTEDFGWFWNVPQGDGFGFPHIRVARFDLAGNRPLIDEPDIYSSSYAWHYGSVGVNERGDKGLVGYAMGGGRNPIARARMIDATDPAWSGTDWHDIITSDDGVDGERWGDYGAVRPYGGCPNMFGGSVYSMQGGPDDEDSEARFVLFGREADSCFDAAFQGRRIDFEFPPVDAGAPINIRGVVRNIGIGRLPLGTRIAIYASRDVIRSSDDIRLPSDLGELPELASGDGAGIVTRVRLPRRARGSFNLIACVEPPAGRQISRTNDCGVTRTAVVAARARELSGLERVSIRRPRRVARTRQHPVRARGRLRLQADVRVRGNPGRRFVRFLLSRRRSLTRRVLELGDRRLKGTRGRGDRRVRLRTKLRLPRAARAGRSYTLFACTLRSKRARPTAKTCLPSTQRVVIRR